MLAKLFGKVSHWSAVTHLGVRVVSDNELCIARAPSPATAGVVTAKGHSNQQLAQLLPMLALVQLTDQIRLQRHNLEPGVDLKMIRRSQYCKLASSCMVLNAAAGMISPFAVPTAAGGR